MVGVYWQAINEKPEEKKGFTSSLVKTVCAEMKMKKLNQFCRSSTVFILSIHTSRDFIDLLDARASHSLSVLDCQIIINIQYL